MIISKWNRCSLEKLRSLNKSLNRCERLRHTFVEVKLGMETCTSSKPECSLRFGWSPAWFFRQYVQPLALFVPPPLSWRSTSRAVFVWQNIAGCKWRAFWLDQCPLLFWTSWSISRHLWERGLHSCGTKSVRLNRRIRWNPGVNARLWGFLMAFSLMFRPGILRKSSNIGTFRPPLIGFPAFVLRFSWEKLFYKPS